MRAFVAHLSFEFRSGVRNRQLLLMNYLFPLGFYLLMGFIMPAINPPFRESMVPAMVVFAVLAATFLGLPDPLVSARESGILRSYRINGIPNLAILTIPALTTVLHLTIATAIICATAPVLFAAPLPLRWLEFAVVFVALVLACAGISVLIGVISPTTRMTVLWSQLIFIPSMLLGGMMLPTSLLPDAAARFAQLLPATHAMAAFSGLAMKGAAAGASWGPVLVLALSGLLAFALAALLFSWDSQGTTRRVHPLFALLATGPYVIALLAW